MSQLVWIVLQSWRGNRNNVWLGSFLNKDMRLEKFNTYRSKKCSVAIWPQGHPESDFDFLGHECLQVGLYDSKIIKITVIPQIS